MYLENRPVENPELLVALEMLSKESTKENQLRVAQAVALGRFLAPINVAAQRPEQDGEPTQPAKVGFMLLKTDKGDSYMPAFSDWSHLLAWNGENIQRAAILTFDEYANLILKDDSNLDGFMINPGKSSITFKRENIEFLKKVADYHAANSVKKQSFNEGAKVMLGDPVKYPEDMLNAISNCLRGEKEVQSAYIRAMKVDEKESWLLVFDLDGDPKELYGGDPHDMFSRVAVAARAFSHDKPLNMILSNAPLSEEAIKNKTPFYTKDSDTVL